MHDEIQFLKNMFRENNYPVHIFENCLRKFLNTIYNDVDKNSDISADRIVLTIPYIGEPSVIFKKKLQKLFKQQMKNDIHCTFRSHKVGMHFSLKDVTPCSLLSCVVYKYTCLRDASLSYIGKTKRHLIVRAKEHLTKESAIQQHLVTCSVCTQTCNVDCFSVIDKCNSNYECLVKEALLIKKFNPKLNNNLYSGYSYQLKVF